MKRDPDLRHAHSASTKISTRTISRSARIGAVLLFLAVSAAAVQRVHHIAVHRIVPGLAMDENSGTSSADPLPVKADSQPSGQADWSFDRRATDKGTVAVTTNPAGVRIFVDGVYIGENTGGEMRVEVEPGIHQITGKLAGYRTEQVCLFVEPGQIESVSLVPRAAVSKRWEAELPDIKSAALLVDEGFVAVVCDEGIHVLDSATGHLLWSDADIRPGKAVADNGILVLVCGNELAARDLRTGDPRWKNIYFSNFELAASAEDRAFIIDEGAALHAVNMLTGIEEWRKDSKSQYTALLATEEVVYLWESGVGCQAFNAVTGKMLWKVRDQRNKALLGLAGSGKNRKVICTIVPEGSAITIHARTGIVEAVEPSIWGARYLSNDYLVYNRQWEMDGRQLSILRWHVSKPVPNASGAIASGGNATPALCVDTQSIYYTSRDRIISVRRRNMDPNWPVSLPGVSGIYDIKGGMLLVESGNTIYALDKATGRYIWWMNTADQIFRVALDHNQSFVLAGNTIYNIIADVEA